MTPLIVTTYVSHICRTPQLVARAAMDDIVRTTPALSGPGWVLRFDRVADDRHFAVLAAGWGQRAGVAIELDPWSSKRVIVGLRHRARVVPWWADAYFAAAHAAVAEITTAVEEWADRPLREAVGAAGVDLFGVGRE